MTQHFTKKETGDYSDYNVGVFYPDEVTPNIILLDLVKDRFEFPDKRLPLINTNTGNRSPYR